MNNTKKAKVWTKGRGFWIDCETCGETIYDTPLMIDRIPIDYFCSSCKEWCTIYRSDVQDILLTFLTLLREGEVNG